eukprot:gene13971-15427_t
MNDIPDLISQTKDLLFALDKYRESIEPISQLIHELIHLGKTFNKIEIKLNEYDVLLNLTPAFLEEGTICLSLLKETLGNIQAQINIYARHTENPDSISDKMWLLFNKSSVHTAFSNFASQIKGHCEHLLLNFLPILNTIINHSFDKEKISQPIHSLSVNDREKIANLILKDAHVMKLFLPKGASKSGNPSAPNTHEHPRADDVDSIDLNRQSSATRFLVNAKASIHQPHHEASDIKEEEELPTPDERISLNRLDSFSAFFGNRRPSLNSTSSNTKSSASRSNSITGLFFRNAAANQPPPAPETTSPGYVPPNPEETRRARANRASFTLPPSHGEFDVHSDYYHVKWFTVLPQIWRDHPNLTFGQIKYIYLSSKFFQYYHNDIYFLNSRTIEESNQLQAYLEGVEEIPIFKQEDYEFVAKLIVDDKNVSMKHLLQVLNTRYQGKREFSFILLLGSELFSTKSRTYESILLEAIHQFPAEEEIWPEGEINLEWTALHVIQKRHHQVK